MPDPTRRDFLMSSCAGLLAATASQLAPPDKQPPNLKVPQPRGKTIGWAIVGLGNLALNQIMPAFREARLSRPVALVSGHPDKARQVAEVYGIDPKGIYSYETYDAMKDNADVQAVYIVLPNSMHAQYTIRAAKVGKHVLCEKPMAANVAEAKQMIAACKEAGRRLMIAYRLRFEPYNQAAIQMCRDKTFGRSFRSRRATSRTPAPRTSASAKNWPAGRWATSASTASTPAAT